MMNPYISWALLLVVAGGIGWYYQGPAPKIRTPIAPAVEKTEAALGAKKPKRKTKKSPEPSAPAKKAEEEKPAYVPEVQESEQDEEIDKKEMAKRFAAVKNGTTPQASNGTSKSQKKKNNKKAAAPSQTENGNTERSASRVSTRTSSTTGAEADDDLSPAGSPLVNASAPAAGYVSDMLEAPAQGASVLRVTGSMEQEAKKKKTQSFKPVETKKQRQQRLKNEVRKQQVQEAEVERRKLQEKQRVGAREAERQAAPKVQPAPQSNAWQTKPVSNGANGTTPKVAQPVQTELLDTFEPSAPSSKSSQPTSSGEWDKGLPSEEEQMRILGAGTDQWTTVSSKKLKPKKSGKADESETSAPETQPTPVATPPPVVERKVKVTPTYLPDILRSNQKGHPLDSDWAA